jgi:hypothetical protein
MHDSAVLIGSRRSEGETRNDQRIEGYRPVEGRGNMHANQEEKRRK